MPDRIRAIGIAWYRSAEDYNRLRAIFTDGRSLPRTFNEWLKLAEEAYNGLKKKGHTVQKAYLDPDTFPAWCAERGLNVDANARTSFANDFVARKLIH